VVHGGDGLEGSLDEPHGLSDVLLENDEGRGGESQDIAPAGARGVTVAAGGTASATGGHPGPDPRENAAAGILHHLGMLGRIYLETCKSSLPMRPARRGKPVLDERAA